MPGEYFEPADPQRSPELPLFEKPTTPPPSEDENISLLGDFQDVARKLELARIMALISEAPQHPVCGGDGRMLSQPAMLVRGVSIQATVATGHDLDMEPLLALYATPLSLGKSSQ